MTEPISQTSPPAPFAPFGAGVALIVGLYLLYGVVRFIREGVFRPDITKDHQPILFWFCAAYCLVITAVVLVISARALGWWAWRTFGTVAPS
jgi:hypothetical protein